MVVWIHNMDSDIQVVSWIPFPKIWQNLQVQGAMDRPFAEKAYIVTGAGSGIGFETTRLLLDAGAVVHAVDLKADLTEELEASPTKLYTHDRIDVSSREQVTAAYSKITSLTPRINGLVNCAGICPGGDGYLATDETFHRTMSVNVTGTWNMTTAFLEILNAESTNTGRGEGVAHSERASIVNIGSSASLCAWPTLSAYTASKHAVLGLTRSWALDWGHKGVRVNLVAPGGTDTPLARAQLNDAAGRGEALTAGLSLIPMGRMGTPKEQADTIVFLLSEKASYITGQVIPVNGGYP